MSTHRPRQPGASLAHHAPARILKFEPIPDAYTRQPPFRMTLNQLVGDAETHDIETAGSMSFHCVGDTGGVKDPTPQKLVARGMEQSLQPSTLAPELRGAAMHPSFFYHLGDVVYYNGELKDYYDQFYGAYDTYPLPILGIPGNHDGEPVDEQATTLEGFHTNFLATQPGTYTAQSQDSGRAAMTQPYFYFTFDTPFATFIGLYSNVPEHGRLDDAQREWFQAEMAAASQDKALIVAVHHPIYSFDSYHSGSPTMAQELQDAIAKSRRVPNMVLSAHVHNYQRIEQSIAGHTVPFLVLGNGGYWNLHRMASVPGYQDPETAAKLVSALDSRHGFMTFDISKKVINGHMTTVPRPQESWTDAQAYNAHFDVFSYSAAPILLGKDDEVSLVPADGSHVQPHTDAKLAHVPAHSQAAVARHEARARHAARTAQKLHGHVHSAQAHSGQAHAGQAHAGQGSRHGRGGKP